MGTANENVSKETALSTNASICISQDNDPVACIGPLFSDDTLAGREACITSTFGQRVSSGVSDEITPREVTDHAPAPVGNACNDTKFNMYVVVVLILVAAKWRTIMMTGWTVLKESLCLAACLEVKSMKVPRFSPRLTGQAMLQ